jgi:hypothetical protein
MPVVDATLTVAGEPAEVERAWYDTSRWAEWVIGFDALVGVHGEWPATGGLVRWRSIPNGRGSVNELSVLYEEGSGQVTEVQDETIEGRQTVAFRSGEGGVEMSLTLDYKVSRRSFVTPLFERLFVNRAMRAALTETLERFAVALGRSA